MWYLWLAIVPVWCSAVQSTTTAEQLDFGVCGRVKSVALAIVVVVKDITAVDWPWLVALGYPGNNGSDVLFKCNAALVSDRWILAAAHCVQNTSDSLPTIARLGGLNMKSNTTDGISQVDVPIDRVYPHENFTVRPPANDIALIRLKTNVTFSRYIRPLCLPSSEVGSDEKRYTHKRLYVTGQSRDGVGNGFSSVLKESDLWLVNNTACAMKYAEQRNVTIDRKVLCTEYSKRETFRVDESTPLMFLEGRARFLLLGGIFSHGHPPFPGVFTKVSEFTDWISGITGFNMTY